MRSEARKGASPGIIVNPTPPGLPGQRRPSALAEAMAAVPELTREDILHWYLAALLLRLGTRASITMEELAKVKHAKIKHEVHSSTHGALVELQVEIR